MLGINAKVEDTKSQIIKVINGAGLPSCLVDYIMTEILNDVRLSRMNAVQKEREAYQQEQQEQASNDAPVMPAPKPKTERKTIPAPGNPTPKEGE